jgi:toxin CcdB
MARFDVRANLNRATRARVPYLLELQADMLSALDTCLVAPLVPAAEFGPAATRLNPGFRIGNRTLVMDTALMAGVSRKLLGERVASLGDRSTEILGAVDFLISGV